MKNQNTFSKICNNLSIKDLKNNYKNKLLIWITGTSNYQTKQATYYSLIEYKNHIKFLTESFSNLTSNQIMLKGIIDAIKELKNAKEPLNEIIIITPTPLGFKSAKFGKGTNVGLINEIVDSAREKGYEVKEVANEGGGYAIKNYITKYNNVKNGLEKEKNIEKTGEYQYQQNIYTQCLKKVINILKTNGVASEIINEIQKIKP